MTRVAVGLLRPGALVVGTPAATWPAALTSSAAHRPLKSRARLFGNARARRLHVRELRRLGSAVRGFFFMGFDLLVLFDLLVDVLGGRLGGQGFVVHFIGDGFGIGSFILVFVVERVFQFCEFRFFNEWRGGRFLGCGNFLGFGLGFLVLGFGQLFGERGYVFVRKTRAVVSVGFGRHRKFGFRLGLSVRQFGNRNL